VTAHSKSKKKTKETKPTDLRLNFKSKLELESNSSKTLPINCKFIRDFMPTLTDETQTRVMST